MEQRNGAETALGCEIKNFFKKGMVEMHVCMLMAIIYQKVKTACRREWEQLLQRCPQGGEQGQDLV